MSLTASEIDVTVGIGTTKVLPSQSGLLNTSSLQTLLEQLVTSTGPTGGSGGTLIFPSVGDSTNPSYLFAGHVTVGTDGTNTHPYSIVIRGDGQQQGGAPLLVQTVQDDLFVVNINDSTGYDDAGGVVFQDLMISYNMATGEPTAGNSGVKVTNASRATRLLRVTLVDWPVGVNFEYSTQCSMINCIVLAEETTDAIAVQIGDETQTWGAIETYIAGCIFFDHTSTGTGMQIYGCEHLRVMNTRIEQWLNGVAITPTYQTKNAEYIYFANVSCHPLSKTTGAGGAALLITTGGTDTNNSFVFHAQFVGCEFSAPDVAATGYQGGGVIIGPASGTKDAIDQIRLLDCHVCRWPGPGLYIVGGSDTTVTPTNIEVVGGYYSCNGRTPGPASGLQAAGIFIVGGSSGPSGIRITGAACNNSLFDPYGAAFLAATQDYGIYVSGAVSSIRVNACDFTGNLTNGAYVSGSSAAPTNFFIRDCDFTAAPIQVVAPVTNLQIVDCPGYNDQKTVITTSPPAIGIPVTIAQLGSTRYYGPAECYVNNAASAVKVDGQSTFLTSGSFYLQPLETIELTATATNFVVIGK